MNLFGNLVLQQLDGLAGLATVGGDLYISA